MGCRYHGSNLLFPADIMQKMHSVPYLSVWAIRGRSDPLERLWEIAGRFAGLEHRLEFVTEQNRTFFTMIQRLQMMSRLPLLLRH